MIAVLVALVDADVEEISLEVGAGTAEVEAKS
jgi:hypothetical protein